MQLFVLMKIFLSSLVFSHTKRKWLCFWPDNLTRFPNHSIKNGHDKLSHYHTSPAGFLKCMGISMCSRGLGEKNGVNSFIWNAYSLLQFHFSHINIAQSPENPGELQIPLCVANSSCLCSALSTLGFLI